MFTKLRNVTCSTIAVTALALAAAAPAFAASETDSPAEASQVSNTAEANLTGIGSEDPSAAASANQVSADSDSFSSSAKSLGTASGSGDSQPGDTTQTQPDTTAPAEGTESPGTDQPQTGNPATSGSATTPPTTEAPSPEPQRPEVEEETAEKPTASETPEPTTPKPTTPSPTKPNPTKPAPAKPAPAKPAATATNNCQIPEGKYTGNLGSSTEIRLGGQSRYETAVKVMEAVKAKGTDGKQAVFLASGANYADALALGALAASHGWPLLLTEGKNLSASTKAALEKLKPTDIYVAGGTNTISNAVMNQAAKLGAKGARTHRFAGATRYETSADIAACFPRGSEAFVASGANFPDAVTAAAPAARDKGAILLTPPGKLGAPAAAALKRLSPKQTFIIGGTWTSSNKKAVEKAGGASATHLAGADRYATSATVARHFYGNTPAKALFANGTGYADALTGVSVSAVLNAPIILSQADCRPSALNGVTAGVHQRVLLGGTRSVSTKSATQTCAKKTTTGQKVVKAAMAQIGRKYMAGGVSPNAGFDCSGLVQYAYKQAGRNIPRTSYAQWAQGKSTGRPQPGDVVVMLGGAHVGVYLGNGKMIDSPKPGSSVGVRDVFAVNAYVRF